MSYRCPHLYFKIIHQFTERLRVYARLSAVDASSSAEEAFCWVASVELPHARVELPHARVDLLHAIVDLYHSRVDLGHARVLLHGRVRNVLDQVAVFLMPGTISPNSLPAVRTHPRSS